MKNILQIVTNGAEQAKDLDQQLYVLNFLRDFDAVIVSHFKIERMMFAQV